VRDITATMRVLRPHPSVYAFYDGRIEGVRLHSPEPNWVDDGGYLLGVAAFAIVDDGDALIYDTHITIGHARRIRDLVQSLGVRRIRVVLSHCHLDHVAGNAVFDDVEMIANTRTLEHLRSDAAAIEAGTSSGPPAISPLVLPGTTFDGSLRLDVGRLRVDLLHLNIHSDDATVAHLPELGLLLAGDTLEDSVTYVDEPDEFEAHLAGMDVLEALAVERILPNHGDPDVIASGGYGPSLIDATRRYVRDLMRCSGDPALREAGLRQFIAPQLEEGALTYFAPYEDVHRQNVERAVEA
jgi:glyoxylase-like metal-dependent hydrolase (beta-lactamase superfamily II)